MNNVIAFLRLVGFDNKINGIADMSELKMILKFHILYKAI